VNVEVTLRCSLPWVWGLGFQTSEITGTRADDFTIVELRGVVVVTSVEVSGARSQVVKVESQ